MNNLFYTGHLCIVFCVKFEYLLFGTNNLLEQVMELCINDLSNIEFDDSMNTLVYLFDSFSDRFIVFLLIILILF